jgi:hypothetical protein
MAVDFRDILVTLILKKEPTVEQKEALADDAENEYAKVISQLNSEGTWISLVKVASNKLYGSEFKYVTNRLDIPRGYSYDKSFLKSYGELLAAYNPNVFNEIASGGSLGADSSIIKKFYDWIQSNIFEKIKDISKAKLAITRENWEEIVIKNWPRKARYDYKVGRVEWEFEEAEREKQAKNILDNAKNKNKDQIDKLYFDFLQSIKTETITDSATPPNSTVNFYFGDAASSPYGDEVFSYSNNLEKSANKYYEGLSFLTPGSDGISVAKTSGVSESLFYTDIGDWAGMKNMIAFRGTSLETDTGQTAEEIQAQVADNAPPPSDKEEETDYNIEEMYQYIDQCVLLSKIKDIADAKDAAEQTKKYPYNLTTIKLKSDQPELILNRLLMPNNMTAYFNASEAPPSQGSVYKVGKTNNATSGYAKMPFDKMFEDVSVEINLKGSNPSTARADMTSKITAQSETFATLMDKEYSTQIFSLLERPGFVANSTGFNRWYRNQYHPNYYKKSIIFKIPQYENVPKKGFYKSVKISNTFTYYGFDTTLIDHTLDNDEETGKLSMTIDSMAYSESLMNLPYLDALGSKAVLDERRFNESLIEQAVESGCNEDTIKELKRTVKEKNKSITRGAKVRILNRLAELNLLSTLEADMKEIKKLYETGIPANSKEVKNKTKNISIWGGSKDTTQEAPEDLDEATRTITFFTLSDLIMVLSEMFYKDPFSKSQKSVHSTIETDFDTEFFPGFEPQFLTFDFNFKQSGSPSNTPPKQINIGDIPIAVSYFSKFMNDQYYSKEMSYVPIGVFLRDIVEKAFTQLISEVCFSDELENRIHFRVSYFKGQNTKNTGIVKTRTAIYGSSNNEIRNKFISKQVSKVPYKNGIKDTELASATPLFSYGQHGNNLNISEESLTDFVVIQAFTQTFTSKNIKDEISDVYEGPNGTVKLDGTIPVIRTKAGQNNDTKKSIVKSMKWKKVEGKYLREQRMFMSNNDAFLAIGNVYNVDISFQTMAPWFVPGQYIVVEPYTGDDSRWYNKESNGYKLGMSGLYVIITANHKFDGKDHDGTTTLNCQWVSSALDDGITRRGKGSNKIDNPDTTELCKEFASLDDQIIYQNLTKAQIQARLDKARTADTTSGATQTTKVVTTKEPAGTVIDLDTEESSGYYLKWLNNRMTPGTIMTLNVGERNIASHDASPQTVPLIQIISKNNAVDKTNTSENLYTKYKMENITFQFEQKGPPEQKDGKWKWGRGDNTRFILYKDQKGSWQIKKLL